MSYRALHEHHRRLNQLMHVDAIVSWDAATMMPQGGGEARADALAGLRMMIHRMATDPALGAMFEAARDERVRGEASAWQAANLLEMERIWRQATSVPAELVEASSRAESRCEEAWRVMRPRNDWASLVPLLREVVARKREVADALADGRGLCRYDALLDAYEPGARSASIDATFSELAAFLPPLIQRALDRQGDQQPCLPGRPVPVDVQRRLAHHVMEQLGFDFGHGRLDVSHHPFCAGVPRDVRVGTRYDEADFTKGLMAVLHETGHAKYEQNLPVEWLDQPVGRARSTALHESQSLLHEMHIGRSREFLAFAGRFVIEQLPGVAADEAAAFAGDNLARLCTRVRRGRIRVEADEATYCCHIILRYEIEKRLLSGELEVEQIPEVWDSAMRTLLDIDTQGDFQDGCMQDVHWPAGQFGYFPTYVLGAVAAAQIFGALRRALPGVTSDIERGDFAPLNAWLRQNLWSQGGVSPPATLLERMTGEPLGTHAFKRHLERRYLERA
jgi:carboxypeptidase Taq